jgi:3-oxoacyl-[acyl-carrier-protein] synthase II
MTDPAVVTGIGVVTPAGSTVGEFFGALCSGRSGLTAPAAELAAELGIDVAGFAPHVDPRDVLPPREARNVDRFILLALAAAERALADAGLEVGSDGRLEVGSGADPRRVAVVVSSTGGYATYEEQAHARARRGRLGVSPYMLPGMLPNMAAARIAIRYGARGPSSTISTACAAGAHAVAEAYRLIRDGDADVVICGGADAPLNPTVTAAFGNSRALATGWADPREASRPFDRRRNGFVLSEGAGILVVERAAHADARGAAGYADLIGWGASSDAHHVTSPLPDGDGAADAMRRALSRAGISPGEVGYVNAHGTATKLGDVAECRAIESVFGAHAPAVSSTKGVTGHPLAAAGAVEAAATALALARGMLPPTRNLDDPDPDCPADHVVKEARPARLTAAMSNSFAFGGHNVSLLFGQPSTRAARGAE